MNSMKRGENMTLEYEPFRLEDVQFATGEAAAAKSLQLCPTLWDPIGSSRPGSAVPGILQARTLKWVAISFSNAWKWKVKSESEVAQPCPTRRYGLQPARLLCPWDFPGKSTGVGCHCHFKVSFNFPLVITTSSTNQRPQMKPENPRSFLERGREWGKTVNP